MQTQRQSVLRLPTVDVTRTGARVVGLPMSLISLIRRKSAHRERLYSWMQTREGLIERNVSPADQSDLSLLVLPSRSHSGLNSAGSITRQRSKVNDEEIHEVVLECLKNISAEGVAVKRRHDCCCFLAPERLTFQTTNFLQNLIPSKTHVVDVKNVGNLP